MGLDRSRVYEVTIAVTRTLLEADGLDAMVAGVLRDIGTMLRWDAGTIWERTDGTVSALATWSARGDDPASRHAGDSLGEAARDAVFSTSHAQREDRATGAAMWLPIVGPDGRVRAVLELVAADPAQPAAAPLEPLADLCTLVGTCFARCRSREGIDGELRLTREHLARLDASDLIGFMISTTGGRILQANDAFLRMVKRTRAELESGDLRWDTMTPPSSLPADHRAVEQLRANGVAPAYEKEYIRSDGTTIPVLLGAALLSRDPMTTVVFVVDNTAQKCTERKLADLNGQLEARVAAGQADLRALTARIHLDREVQLTSLAREIHDVFGQELTLLKVDTAWLGRRLEDRYGRQGPEVVERIAAIEERLDSLFVGLSTIASELRPRILDDVGLVPAIVANARSITRRTGLVIELAMPDDLSLSRDLATGLFRIYQELMTNILRHARATRAEVAVSVDAGVVELRVVDNGIGFVPVARGSTSFGLLGIRERVLAFGGSFSMARAPGGGTVATLSVPHLKEFAS